MRLRGIDFGYALSASGARGFYGEGYWFHRPWQHLGLDYRGAAFVAKTLTLQERAGNMPLKGARPMELLPKSIVVKPWQGAVLNAVGLSNPGAARVLDFWSKRYDLLPAGPKMLSFMSVGDTPEVRLGEVRGFAHLLAAYLPSGHPVREKGLAIQLNLSCPNAGLDNAKTFREAREALDALTFLDLPVLIKVSAVFAPDLVRQIADHPACDGVVCSNSIPWGKLSMLIDWKGIFGTDTSPLAEFGGGGLSGAPILPICAAWVKAIRNTGYRKLLVGGGGILDRAGATRMITSGADAIEVGSASILRPWRVRAIIHRAIEMLADA